MWRAVADRAYGKPDRPIEQGGDLTIHVVRTGFLTPDERRAAIIRELS